MGVKAVIFKEEMSRYIFNMTAGTFGRVLALAVVVGLFTWLLAFALDKYMLTPIFCGNDDSVSVCMNSTVMGANIATVLMGVMAVPLMVVLRIKRALLVIVAAVAALWGVAAWMAGAWYVSLIWTLGAYAVVYAALVWINRLRGDLAAIVFMAMFAILARIAVSVI